jgi:hypothetical protein
VPDQDPETVDRPASRRMCKAIAPRKRRRHGHQDARAAKPGQMSANPFLESGPARAPGLKGFRGPACSHSRREGPTTLVSVFGPTSYGSAQCASSITGCPPTNAQCGRTRGLFRLTILPMAAPWPPAASLRRVSPGVPVAVVSDMAEGVRPTAALEAWPSRSVRTGPPSSADQLLGLRPRRPDAGPPSGRTEGAQLWCDIR